MAETEPAYGDIDRKGRTAAEATRHEEIQKAIMARGYHVRWCYTCTFPMALINPTKDEGPILCHQCLKEGRDIVLTVSEIDRAGLS